LLLYKTGK